MHPSISLVEEALAAARRELSLLDEGDMDAIEAAAEKRMRLLDDAWKQRTDDCAEELSKRLEVMRDLQEQLVQKTRKLHDSLAEELKDMRRRNTRQKGYQQACSNPYPDIPVFISRRS